MTFMFNQQAVSILRKLFVVHCQKAEKHSHPVLLSLDHTGASWCLLEPISFQVVLGYLGDDGVIQRLEDMKYKTP